MTDPREPESTDLDVTEPEFIPPDPDESPPPDLASLIGDITPWGTLLLLLSWALVFAVLAFRRETGNTDALFAWGASAPHLAARDTAWRLLASTFLHAGLAHVFFNALSMAIFGPAVERMFTRPGFAVIYAAGGATASLASLTWRGAQHPAGLSISVGASGAIFALGGAMLACAWLAGSAWLYPTLNPVRSSAVLMRATEAALAPGEALGIVRYREQFLLQAHVPITHFGYRRADTDEELRDAVAWLEAGPQRRLLVDDERLQQCFHGGSAQPIGFASDQRWYLVHAADASQECAGGGSADQAIVYEAPQ